MWCGLEGRYTGVRCGIPQFLRDEFSDYDLLVKKWDYVAFGALNDLLSGRVEVGYVLEYVIAHLENIAVSSKWCIYQVL